MQESTASAHRCERGNVVSCVSSVCDAVNKQRAINKSHICMHYAKWVGSCALLFSTNMLHMNMHCSDDVNESFL